MIYPLSLSAGTVTEYPVTLKQVKAHLRIAHDDFDSLIVGLRLPAALQWLEAETRRSVASKTCRWTLAGFPPGAEPIRLPMGKANAVASIAYVSNGQTVTLRGPTSGSPVGTDYQEDLSADWGGVVMPAAGSTWPTADADVPAPVIITFTAGWSAAECPADLKLAMLWHIGESLDATSGADLPPNYDPTIKDTMASGWRLR